MPFSNDSSAWNEAPSGAWPASRAKLSAETLVTILPQNVTQRIEMVNSSCQTERCVCKRRSDGAISCGGRKYWQMMKLIRPERPFIDYAANGTK